MIIDYRLRPPFAGIEKTQLFIAEYSQKFANMFQAKTAQSVYEKSMELLFQEMDEAGVTKGVCAVRTGINNQDLVEAIEEYGDRFYGVMNVEIKNGEKSISQESLEEIDRLAIHGPLVGVSMEPAMKDDLCVDDPRLFSVYDKCQAAGLPIMFTSNIYSPDHYAPMRLVNVFRNFPKLRVSLLHGCPPYSAAVCQLAYMHENLFISPDCYMMGAPGHRDFIDGANTLIPNQIIFGSAYPAMPIGFAVNYYKNCGLREDVLENVMYNNAMRALGLDNKTTVDVPRMNRYGANK